MRAGTGSHCHLGERIRVTEWLDDDPYPRADVEPWPDEPDAGVDPARLADVENRIIALFERIAAARGGELRDRDAAARPRRAATMPKRLYALANSPADGSCRPVRGAGRARPAARLDALSEAVDTVIATVEFQLSE